MLNLEEGDPHDLGVLEVGREGGREEGREGDGPYNLSVLEGGKEGRREGAFL